VDSGEDGIRSFPLDVGNRWVYNRYSILISSSGRTRPDTFANQFVRRVIGVDTSIATAGLTIVDDSVEFIDLPGTPSWYLLERHWWSMTDNEIFEIAAWNSGQGPWLRPIFWEWPLYLLDFPLSSGKSWSIEQSDFGMQEKRVIDFQNYSFGERTYYCALVRTLFDSNPRMATTEWYSNSGLLYSHAEKGVLYIYGGNRNIIDSVYYHQDLQLTGIYLAE
jgi:hypothetical protein